MSDVRVDFWLWYGLRRAGDPAAAKAIAERGLKRAEASDDVHTTVMLAAALSRAELADLRPGAARAYLSHMETHAERADTAALLVVLQTRAYHLGYAGDWKHVSELCDVTKARLRLAGSYQVASAKVLWAEAQFALGRTEIAVKTMREALPHLQEMKDVCRVHIARILASTGATTEAVEDVRRYLEAASGPGNVRSGGAVVGDAAAAFDEPDLWEPAYELVLKEPALVTLVYSPTSVSRVRGRLATRLKRWTDAIDHFEAAIAHLTKGGADWELLRTYQDYAVMRRARARRGDSGKANTLDVKAAQVLEGTDLATPPTGVPYATELQANEYGLSRREVEVLQLVAGGLRNKEIAEELSLSPHTVERHLENVYSKMGAKGRADAVIRAAEASIIVGDRNG